MYNNYFERFLADEILVYMRKSRSDDPLMSVEEVLSKHWSILSDWLNRNVDGTVPEENIYREVVSGETIDGRPEVLKILSRIENPRIKAILVVEVQRLSRGDLEDCGRLIKLLRYTKTKVITPQKIYDLEDDYDRDAFERELKRGNEYLEYTKKILERGRLQSVASGNYLGSVAPFGADKTYVMDGKRKCPTIAFNETSKVVIMMFDMAYDNIFSEGYCACGKIGRKLNAMGIKSPTGKRWTYHQVIDILMNPIYNGKVTWNRRKTVKVVENMEVRTYRPFNDDFLCFPAKHPTLIPDDKFNIVQQYLTMPAPPKKESVGLRNILSGILYCECGRAMRLHSYIAPKETHAYYAPRFYCSQQSYCNNGSILETELLKIVFDALSDELNRFEAKAAENTEPKEAPANTISLLTKQLENLEKKRIALWDKYTDEDMPRDIFESLKKKCEEDIESSKKALDEAYKKDTARVDLGNTIFSLQQAAICIYDDSIPLEHNNLLLRSAIKKITYSMQRTLRTRGKSVKKSHAGWDSAEPQITIEFNF